MKRKLAATALSRKVGTALAAASIMFAGKSMAQDRKITFGEDAPKEEAMPAEPEKVEINGQEVEVDMIITGGEEEKPKAAPKPKEQVKETAEETEAPAEETTDAPEEKSYRGQVFILNERREIYGLGRIHPLGGIEGTRKQYPELGGNEQQLVLNNNAVRTWSAGVSVTIEVPDNAEAFGKYKTRNGGRVYDPKFLGVGLAAEYSRFNAYGYSGNSTYKFTNNNLVTVTPSATMGFSLNMPSTLTVYGSVGFENVNNNDNGFANDSRFEAYMNGVGVQLNLERFAGSTPVFMMSRAGIANTGTTAKNWLGYATGRFNLANGTSRVDVDLTPHVQYLSDEARAGGTLEVPMLFETTPTSSFGVKPSFRGESNFMAGSFLGEGGLELSYLPIEHARISVNGGVVFESNAQRLSIPVTPFAGLTLDFKN